HMSLAEVFQSELVLSVQCCLHNEFFEGVRALLVDKDSSPNWRFSSVASVDRDLVQRCFHAPWVEHPLQSLGVS
ncbi:MAG: enoyl-CoA hydratase/isomerase family protein, partial [Granulosicoccaceae bacterium]